MGTFGRVRRQASQAGPARLASRSKDNAVASVSVRAVEASPLRSRGNPRSSAGLPTGAPAFPERKGPRTLTMLERLNRFRVALGVPGGWVSDRCIELAGEEDAAHGYAQGHVR